MNKSQTKTTYYDAYPLIHYKILSSSQRRLFSKILNTQSVSGIEEGMIKTISKIVNPMKDVSIKKDKYNNLFIEKHLNNYPPPFLPLLVAHMDTVHPILQYDKTLTDKTIYKHNIKKTNKPYKVYKTPHVENKGFIYFSNSGVGGDDKNGLFIILEMLRNTQIKHLKVLLTTEEEIGQIGAKYAILNNKEWFANISYMIEPDRKGNCDIINKWGDGSTISNKLEKHLQPIFRKFKYKITSGSVTDIFPIFENLEVSCFNYSCGYYEPHTSQEYIKENDLKRALDFTYYLLKTIPLTEIYIQEYKAKSYKHHYSNYSNKAYKPVNSREIILKDMQDIPLKVRFQPASDYFFFANNYTNKNTTHLYTEVERIFIKMQAISTDLNYFIKNNFITFEDYSKTMDNLLDTWAKHMQEYNNKSKEF